MTPQTTQNSRRYRGDFAACGRNRGVALILVLWMVALLTIIAASFSTQSKVESRLAGNSKDALQAKLLAESGFSRAVMELMVISPQQRWNFNGQLYPLQTAQGELEVSIRNASGLLDLNKASSDQLNRLFGLISDDPEERNALVDRLHDWRDADDLRRLNGAEDKEYRAAGYDYATAGKDLTSLEELAYVMGFDAARVNRLRPYVTLNSDSATVDYRFASEQLTALLTSTGQSGSELTEALDQLDSELADLDLSQGGGTSQSKVFRIEVSARTKQGGHARIVADVGLKNRGRKPYSIHSWYESL
ncbi:MAG: type II secretion system protein GspK [Candidatus Thiodiazotropha taylori]|uniref:Type II secretion system protein GspK n=1 Tax=Candidatus Thiodiazotropha taylori TaxID=2792791 RepID=A0A9E4P5X5_9GAMM|nr:type II secretion system protein GspK [Candidatus Thiodiazotropha taylori]MCG7965695.1 type II secretion system protein GspK [Candidatus Thiodiazotropha taylori]MCG8028025.1 type II secretion system protein GspK [Candidatus Thiodiazotropha taylori]MCG8108567.1 type II secretion system protein GspK [Candidatus Thiodiazotropha taylori]MCG8112395.1 type II secretion system protein GspK [Candidatus Thiodiazotropha taylori]